MKFANLKAVSDAQVLDAYKTDIAHRAGDPGDPWTEHGHHQISKFCGTTYSHAAMTWDEINLSTLKENGCENIARLILDGIRDSGIRPDTPFHENREGRYVPDRATWTRYMELNALTGGVRLIYDATLNKLFLSCHYAYPAALTGGTDADIGAKFATELARIGRLQKLMQKHVDGEIRTFLDDPAGPGTPAQRAKYIRVEARRDARFTKWLAHEKSGQPKAVIAELYNLNI